MRRYSRDQRIAGGLLQTAQSVSVLRRAKEFGLLNCRIMILKESQRLDHVAYKELGDPHAWWIIAALSNIGWGMQLPPGTILYIPENMTTVQALVG
jgi:hypothetical protein